MKWLTHGKRGTSSLAKSLAAQLAPEILNIIFGDLNDWNSDPDGHLEVDRQICCPRTLLSASIICRSWSHSATPILYSEIYVFNWLSALQLIRTLQNTSLGMHVLVFGIHMAVYEVGRGQRQFGSKMGSKSRLCKDDLFDVILRNCPNLSKLIIQGYRGSPGPTHPDPGRCPVDLFSNLRSLRLHASIHPDTGSSHWLVSGLLTGVLTYPNLEELFWHTNTSTPSAIPIECPKLRRMHIVNSGVFTVDVRPFLKLAPTALEELSLEYITWPGDANGHLLNRFAALKTLALKHVKFADFSATFPELMYAISTILQDLTVHLSDFEEYLMWPSFDQLRRVSITASDQSAISLLNTAAYTLEEVKLYAPGFHVIHLHPNLVRSLEHIAPRLTSFSLLWHSELETKPDVIAGIFSSMHNLQTLRLALWFPHLVSPSQELLLLRKLPVSIRTLHLHADGYRLFEGHCDWLERFFAQDIAKMYPHLREVYLDAVATEVVPRPVSHVVRQRLKHLTAGNGIRPQARSVVGKMSIVDYYTFPAPAPGKTSNKPV